MSEKTKNRPNKKPNYSLRRRLAATGLAGAVAVGTYAGVKLTSQEAHPAFVAGKEYVVKPGDTAWGILEKAYPNSDPREGIYQIDKSLPNDSAHYGGLLQPGDKLILDGNAKLGREVTVSSQVEGQLPAVVPQFEGQLEPKDYGKLAEAVIDGQTMVVPNAPPPPPAG